MSKIKKTIFSIIFIIFDIFLVVGILFIRDATNINNLKKEIKSISKLDISSDSFKQKYKTSGKYRIVEMTIKEFLDENSSGMKVIYKIIDDEKLFKILSYDNYKNDGPEFKDSIKYLNEKKKLFNTNIDKLISNLEEKNIKQRIRSKLDDKYYISLYDDLVFLDSLVYQYDENRDLLIMTKDKYNNIFDTSLDVLNFLVLYKDSWKIENGEIKFKNQDLLNYYNDLISKVSTK